MSTSSELIHQAAAIPLRDGRICLVTSSSGRRWVIPKGRMEPGKSPAEIALQEAWEEAGLIGAVGKPLGTYQYEKFGDAYLVTVFAMQVLEERADWPEAATRRREWLSPDAALERIEEADLREMICRAVVGAPMLRP